MPSWVCCCARRFVNYADSSAAERARQCMNGMRAGDKILHVIVQTNGRHVAPGAQAPAAPAPMPGAPNPPFLTGHAMAPTGTDWQQLLPVSAPLMW